MSQVEIAMSREEAGKKVIPFGKYQSLTVESVFHIPGGSAFLESLLNERFVGSPLKQAIRIFLDGDGYPE